MLHDPRGVPCYSLQPHLPAFLHRCLPFLQGHAVPLRGMFFPPTMPSKLLPLLLLHVTAAANATEQAPSNVQLSYHLLQKALLD